MQVCEASFKEAGFDYIVTEKMVCAGGEKGEEQILILICLKTNRKNTQTHYIVTNTAEV